MSDDPNTIADEHVLPCDFTVGHITFRKGVKLETVRQAAERWHKGATAHFRNSVSETTFHYVGPPR